MASLLITRGPSAAGAGVGAGVGAAAGITVFGDTSVRSSACWSPDVWCSEGGSISADLVTDMDAGMIMGRTSWTIGIKDAIVWNSSRASGMYIRRGVAMTK